MEAKTLDEPELTARVSEIDDRIDIVHEAATHAYVRANEANDLSRIAIDHTNTLRIATVSYQSVIDQLKARITKLEREIEIMTGPCYCESLL